MLISLPHNSLRFDSQTGSVDPEVPLAIFEAHEIKTIFKLLLAPTEQGITKKLNM